jgi:GntR family transcriptional regulator
VREQRPALEEGPLYKEIRRQLTKELASGVWRPGDPLPPESRLAQRFDVSIGTLRKAIDKLVADRILVRRHGRGTFVTTHGQSRLFFEFFRIVPVDGEQQYPETHTLSFRSGRADSIEARNLLRPLGDPVHRIRNLRLLGGKPAIIDDLVLPKTLFPDLTLKIFTERENTIYNLYQTRYGRNVVRTKDRLRAVRATADVAQLLSLAKGEPVLQIERVAFSLHGTPIEFRRSNVNSRSYEYLSELGGA